MIRSRFGNRLWAAMLLVVLVGSVTAQAREEITIYRDGFGTPHVFADSAEGACFGHGYAQASDRLEELLKQYMRASGTMSEAFGPSFFRDDYRQRLYRHAAVSKEKYPSLDDKTRSLIEAYQAGVKQYMAEHPSEVPDWAPEIEPWMCVALGRYIIWGWPEGEAGGDLRRIGIEPDPVEYHGSNEWLVAADRTAYDAPIALIDPHLSWYGAFRFYEARLYGGEIEFSGMAILGNPLPALGHSRYCSIAMTTGGPDTSDVYEEELNPDNPRQYRYDGAWLDMEVIPEVIKVKTDEGVDEQTVEIEYTRHGPVVARKDGKAYVFAIPYADQVGLAEQTYKMCVAKNLEEMKEALAMQQLMMQNIMIGTTEGDIYYVRVGRVPVRPKGYDHKGAMPGNTSKADWQGIHPFEDLVQIENPPQGYMQNCNVSPQFLMKGCPLEPSPEAPYLFNGFTSFDNAHDNPLHQRAAMCVELLHNAQNMTVDQAIDIAMSPAVYGVEPWQELLRKAWSDSKNAGDNEDLRTFYELIIHWNGRCDANSTGAIAYKYWKELFGDDVKTADRAGMPPPESVTDEMLLEKLAAAAKALKKDFGRLDVAYGDVYRVGRRGTGENWPVSGGSVRQIATPRAISFDRLDGTPQYLGRGGQTSTQIVLLTEPPKSWTVLPLGESDDADSPHYDDQAEKLFSHGRMKPTYFLDKEGLLDHATDKVVVYRNGDAPAPQPAKKAKKQAVYKQTQNIVYGETDGIGLVLDVFAPTGKSNGLGIVDVASGAYHSDRGKIEDHRRARVYDTFCGKGYTMFAVRPGSITKFSVPEMAKNLDKGIAWVKEHADQYGIDPNRLGLTGASAGGHLASLAAVTADDSTAVKAAGVFFPPTNFLEYRGVKLSDDAPKEHVERLTRFAFPPGNGPVSTSELAEKLEALSPALLVTPQAPPFLLIHGDADPLVPLAQSKMLLAALEKAGVPAELIVKKGGGHPWLTIHEEVQIMADWFDEQLSEK